MLTNFGAAEDVREDRAPRFLEEALELGQATGVSREDAIRLVDYVYGRPEGDAFVETGDVLFTLAGLAASRGIKLHHASFAVGQRAEANAAKIAAKRARRPDEGPLPGTDS